jgi:hypothetical protein
MKKWCGRQELRSAVVPIAVGKVVGPSWASIILDVANAAAAVRNGLSNLLNDSEARFFSASPLCPTPAGELKIKNPPA